MKPNNLKSRGPSWDPRPNVNPVSLRKERDYLATKVANGTATPEETKRLQGVARQLRRCR